MKNISPMRYPGAKTKLLPELLTHLNSMIINSDTFVDAFVGGGSVALAVAEKYPDKKIHINDLDKWMYSFWSVVINDPYDLIQRLDVVPTIEMFYEISNTQPVSELDLAFRAIFFNRCCYSGIVKRNKDKIKSSPQGGKNQNSQYKIGCRFNFKNLKKKINLCHKILKNKTTISNLDINSFLKNEFSNSALYLDPPYYEKGAELYNSFMSENDHKDMSNILQTKENWLLSIDDNIKIRDFYKSNKIIDISARYSINGKKTQWSKKNELLILKF